MCPAINDFNFVSAPHWESVYYSAMAVASKATEVMHEKTTKNIELPLRFWKLSRDVKELAETIGKATAAGRSETPQESVQEPADIDTVIDQLESLGEKWESLYLDCKRYGYTNRTLTAGSINSTHRNMASIGEFTARIKQLVERRAAEIFRQARVDRDAEGVVPMSSVF
jgi:hypothetical protein